MLALVGILMCAVALIQGFPSMSEEQSAYIQRQAQEDYNKHQDVVNDRDQTSSTFSKNGYNGDGSYGVTFDNQNKEHRDRGYGYEKAYAYSRETAFFDFVDDKGALNAKDIVEKYGNSQSKNEENLFSEVAL